LVRLQGLKVAEVGKYSRSAWRQIVPTLIILSDVLVFGLQQCCPGIRPS